jgi:hypothetical protein
MSLTSDGIKSMKQDSWVCLLCGDSEKDLRLVLATGDQIKHTTVLILKQGMVSCSISLLLKVLLLTDVDLPL